MKSDKYIVWSPAGNMYLVAEEGNTLWLGGAATVFTYKKRAQRAIDRTKKLRDAQYPGQWEHLDQAYVQKVRVQE